MMTPVPESQSHGVVANPEAFWGLRPRFESWWDYSTTVIPDSALFPYVRDDSTLIRIIVAVYRWFAETVRRTTGNDLQ